MSTAFTAKPIASKSLMRSRKVPAGNGGAALRLASLEQPSRSAQVVEQLTRLILNGELKPKELLPPERDLALQLGVSRNVVREAIKILQSRGLLTIRHGVGTIVNAVSSEPLQQVFTHALHGQEDALLKLTEVRLLVEVEMAALAAQRAKKENLQKIRKAFEAMEANVGDPRSYVQCDREFHSALAEATQNNVFALVMEATSALTRQARVYALKSGSSVHQSLQIHREILEAVEAGDAALAAAKMREHLQMVENDLKSGVES